MAEPRLRELGVYRPVISEKIWQEQLQGTGNEEAAGEHYEKLALIEAVVEGLSEPFDMSKFRQPERYRLESFGL